MTVLKAWSRTWQRILCFLVVFFLLLGVVFPILWFLLVVFFMVGCVLFCVWPSRGSWLGWLVACRCVLWLLFPLSW